MEDIVKKELVKQILEKGIKAIQQASMSTMDWKCEFFFDWLNELGAYEEATKLYETYSK